MNTSRQDRRALPTQPEAPEPSRESQADIARRVQEDLKEVNKQSQDRTPSKTGDQKATQFDGSPKPKPDPSPNWFKPKDDAPAILPKRHGPKNPD